MKLLFDANLSPALCGRLADLYTGSVHVAEVGLERSDTDIWNHAKEHGFTIVSKDSDFEQRALVFGAPPKVVWIRLGNCRSGVVEALLRQRFEDVTAFGHDPNETLLAIP